MSPQPEVAPASAAPLPHERLKAVAAWLAFGLGAFGAHRFYLRGWRDAWGWAFPLPTFAGLVGVRRMQDFGVDDRAAWWLLPFLGTTISIAMLSAILIALTPDDRWHRRWNPGHAPRETGWAPVLAAVASLLVGGIVLMGTIAFSIQKAFESAL